MLSVFVYLTPGPNRKWLGHSDQLSNILAQDHVSSWDDYLQCHTHKSAPVSVIDDHDIDLRLIHTALLS